VTDVVIVGGGLAGLACARTLTAAGFECTILEASDGIGGRVRSDELDGFTLDRGFQILLTAYPEARAQLDYEALDLQAFAPGALVRTGASFARLADPLRAPITAWSTLRAPIGTFADKLRVARTVAEARVRSPRALLQGADRSTASELDRLGFSPDIVEHFFRPLFAGIQLDPELEVSSRRFWIIWRMLAAGASAVPAGGMGVIPSQLASTLPAETIRCHASVQTLDGTTAVLADGERVTGRALVVATEGPAAVTLLGLPPVASRGVACAYFACDDRAVPYRDPLLTLDGTGDGPACNVAIMSNVAPSYAPPGRALIAAAVPGPDSSRPDLDETVRAQLRGWWGDRVDTWTHLRTYRIAHGQPDQRPPFHPKQQIALGSGRYVCGDHRDTASIQGALYSGRRTGERVIADFA
jgi:phytoene dehydrogenase-like protein